MRARSRRRSVAILRAVPLLTARISETVAPSRLGRSFRWLLASSVISNVGDGIALAAGPLLVASLTRDPLLVSMALLAQQLPNLLFGLPAGAIADRFDRRRIVAAVNLARAAVLAVLAATIVGGAVSIAVVLLTLFILGTAEIFADVSSSSLVPRVVPAGHLGIANARLTGSFLLTNELLGPPIGAFLFTVGMALPFAANAACFALGAVLVTRVATDVADLAAERSGERGSLRTEMAEGIRWLIAHPPMRTLALTIIAFNVTYGAAWSVLVLYASERLGMSAVGFGLLTTAIAIGGIVGTSAYGRLERRFSLADIMRGGLLIETFTHLVLALTTSPAVALVTMVVFGAHAFVWGTTSTVVRQRAVPDELLGRVTGVYTVGLIGGIVIGTPIGGLLAREFGITAPFWFGFIGSAILVAAAVAPVRQHRPRQRDLAGARRPSSHAGEARRRRDPRQSRRTSIWGDLPVSVPFCRIGECHGEEQYSFLVIKYPYAETGQDALATVREIAKEGVVKLRDAVAITKTEKGKIKIHQTKDDSIGRGFVKGGVIGILFAALFGPVGWIAMGAAAGGLFASFDRGIKNRLLKELGQDMTPEESALALLVEEADWPEAVARMKSHGFGGTVVVQELVGDDIEQVEKLLEDPKTVEAAPEELDVSAEPRAGRRSRKRFAGPCRCALPRSRVSMPKTPRSSRRPG